MVLARKDTKHPFDIETLAGASVLDEQRFRRRTPPLVPRALGGNTQPSASGPYGTADPMTNKREMFVSVDVETTAWIPGEYSLLTIGARLVDDAYADLQRGAEADQPQCLSERHSKSQACRWMICWPKVKRPWR